MALTLADELTLRRRALRMIEALRDAMHDLEETVGPRGDDLYRALDEATAQRDAMAETIKTLPADVRQRLIPVYRAKLEEAEVDVDRDGEFRVGLNKSLLADVDALLEEARRDELLGEAGIVIPALGV